LAVTKKQRLVREYTLNDIPEWYGNRCGWRMQPPGRAWVDTRPDSAYMRCIKFFRTSWEVAKQTGRYIFMWLAPRRSGKSTIMQTEALRLIARNRNTEVTYVSETENRGKRASMWMRGRLQSPKLTKIFGKFRTNAWSANEWWVDRPSGPGGDPTVSVVGAESASTGFGWDLFCGDDTVGKKTCETPAAREKVITSFEEFHRQRAPGTLSVIWIIGTMWRGWQLYRYILENLHKYANVVIIPAIGCAQDQYGNPLWGQPDEYNYPWIDEKRLKVEWDACQDKEDYWAQMFNMITQAKDFGFKLDMLADGVPPLLPGETVCSPTTIDREQSAIYMLVDPCGSGVGSSKTAIGIVAKTADGKTYLLEAKLGGWALDRSAEMFIEMWQRWKPRWYPLETQGPAIGFRTTLNAMCQRDGIPIPPCREVSRWGYSKPSRIEQLYPPMNCDPKLFFFCPHTLSRQMYHRNADGIVTGIIRDTFMRYDPTSQRQRGSDLLDMLADSVITDRKQVPLCAPPPRVYNPKPEVYESEAMQAFRRMHGPGYGYLPPIV
jgi:hypothetical protein